jgi:hypothetical protein
MRIEYYIDNCLVIDIISLSSENGEEKLKSQNRISSLQNKWEQLQEQVFDSSKPSHPILKSRRSFRKSGLFSRPFLAKSYYLADEEFKWPVSRFREFCLLLVRYSKVELRNHKGNIQMFLQFIVFALVLGFVFFQLTTENFGGFQSRLGLLNFVQGYLFLISTEIAVVWASYRSIVIRERASNTFRVSSAYFAKFLSQLPIRMFSVFCFGTIVYYIAGLRTNTFTAYLLFVALLLSTYLCSICFGMAVSTFSKSPRQAIIIDMVLIYVFILYAGFIVNSKSITPIFSWIRFTSPIFYGVQGFIQNECNDLMIAGQPASVYVADYDLNQISVPWCIASLLFFSVGFFAIGLLGMFKNTKNKYIVI